MSGLATSAARAAHGVLVLTFLVMAAAQSGCGGTMDDEVAATARDDLNCDHVEVTQTGSRRRTGGKVTYVVEGCGQIAYYECFRSDGCTLRRANELRSN